MKEQTKCYCGHTTYCDCGPEEPKQETLEEVAEKLTKDFPHYSVRDNMDDSEIKGWFLDALQKGAKWQQERSYNEEEVWNICNELASYFIGGDTFDLKEWFEQFKNKYKMAVKNGIGYSPLTEKVYLGKQNTEKRLWVGDKKDITNEFLAVASEFFEENTVRDIGCSNGASNLFINIKNDKASIEKVIKNLTKRVGSLK